MKTTRKLPFLTILLFFGCTSTSPKIKIQRPVLDHVYQLTEDENRYFSMGERGFTVHQKKVVHPGPLDCRFIYFTPKDYPSYQYLEWCFNPDLEKLKQKESQDGSDWTPIGLGFRSESSLDSFYQLISGPLSPYDFELTHKNYNWQENSTDRLPGWNYVSSKKTFIPNISFFAAEYEQRSPKKPKKFQESHDNTAEAIIAVILHASDIEFSKVEIFAGNKTSATTIENHDRLHLYNVTADSAFSSLIKQKTNKVLAVIIRVKNIKKFIGSAKPDYNLTWRGTKLYGIKSPNSDWDILATDSLDLN